MDEALEYYRLDHIRLEPNAWRLASAAILDCDLCGRNIDASGGPGHGTICMPCGDALKAGKLRGAVKWDEQP